MTGASVLRSARPARRDPWLLALAALVVLSFATLMVLGRGTTFVFDDWNFWLSGDSLSPSNLLAAYNGQPSLVPKLLWVTTTKVFGGGEYLPFRIEAYLLLAAFLVGFFFVLAPRVPRVIAFATVVPLSVLGTAWLTLLMVNTLHYFVIPLVFLVWAVVALDRATRAGDVVACVLLVLSAFTSSSGVVPVAAAAVYLLWERPAWRRLWVPAVPTALFLLWFAVQRPEQVAQTTISDIALIPSYVFEGLSDGLARYTALGGQFTVPLAAALLIAIFACATSPRGLDRAAAAFIAGGATFWTLLALGRGPELHPGTIQYLYANATYAIAAGVLLLARVPGLTTVRVAVAALVLAAAFAEPNLQQEVDAARDQRAASQRSLAALTATNLLAERDPARASATNLPLVARGDNSFAPAAYVRAVRAGREPVGATAAELAQRPSAFRRDVDTFLAQALGGTPSPAASLTGAGAPPAIAAGDGVVKRAGACQQVTPAAGRPTASVELTADRPLLVVGGAGRGKADVRAWRLAGRALPTDPPLASVGPRGGVLDLKPFDGAPWMVSVAAAGPFRVCGAA